MNASTPLGSFRLCTTLPVAAPVLALGSAPAVAALSIVSSTATTAIVFQRQTGLHVEALVSNAGSSDISLTASTLKFYGVGGVDRSTDYTVAIAPDNAVSISVGTSVVLTFTVAVASTARTGLVTIQPFVTGVDSGTAAVSSAVRALTAASWVVSQPEVFWEQLFASGVPGSPPARSLAAMAFDAARGRAVLFGGADATDQVLSDTWEWDGSSWHEMHPATSPVPDTGDVMAYDPVRKRIVLLADPQDASHTAKTWEWDGANWTDRTPASRPSLRYSPVFEFDPGLCQVLMFGGEPFGGPPLLTETWAWSDLAWTRLNPATSPPPLARAGWLTLRARATQSCLPGGWRATSCSMGPGTGTAPTGANCCPPFLRRSGSTS
ncbi:MAG: hypothetical protein HY303_02805 [Candidatus Wallbacteria bacterium]|nr:hypothetical protein [Candidatus Wallbacteria bacterium]